MKECNADGCTRPQFGGGFCSYHGFRRYMRGGDKYKQKTKPPAKSKKRQRDEKYYAENCRDLTKEIQAKNNGKVFCFFSGLEITPPVHYHHLKKRIGEFYTDKEWLVPALDEYHLAWHGGNLEWLLKQDWYTRVFLPNLKAKSQELYDKEIARRDKVNKLNPPKLFDYEEEL